MLTAVTDLGPSLTGNEDQETIQELYLDLRSLCLEGSIEPKPIAGIAEDRELLTLFGTLVISGIKLGVFSGMVKVWQKWLESRPRAEVTIMGKDGSILLIRNASPEEAMRFFKQQEESKSA